jgi:hypothetical protein
MPKSKNAKSRKKLSAAEFMEEFHRLVAKHLSATSSHARRHDSTIGPERVAETRPGNLAVQQHKKTSRKRSRP